MAYLQRLQQAKARRTAAANRAAAVSVNADGTAMLTAVWNPNEYALNSHMEQAVMNLRKSTHPPNTIKAIDTKQEEYLQHCDKEWSHDPYR